MALQPSKFNGQDRLQPGSRGEVFQADYPGYRNQGDRLNRTNNKLNTNAHDVPNIKYEFDRRLPVLFRYGFAYGYNQIVIPKGRIVAADPFMDLVDFDMRHAHNTLTIANGGAPVRLRTTTDAYRDDAGSTTALVSSEMQGQKVNAAGKEWIPVIGMTDAYTDVTYRPFKAAGPNSQLATAGYSIDANTGKAVKIDPAKPDLGIVRPGNVPTGVLFRNEYTRNDDAYNGIMPGSVMTDAMIELPWFAYKDKAEENPWGSAYGGLFPGALVKSDENGRFVVSPLSFPEKEAMTGIMEYELERQQIVGQVYSVDNSLIPEGAAKWATWALEDRLNFIEFNPDIYRMNNRDGEDSINNSPFNAQAQYPGYPYDKAYTEHDLHMLASTVRHYSDRMNQAYQYENLGIPGLTDGQNAARRMFNPEVAGTINYAGGQDYVEMFFRASEVNLEPGSLTIAVGDSPLQPCVKGALIAAQIAGQAAVSFLQVVYVDELQGLLKLAVTDKAAADAFLSACTGKQAQVKLQFAKKGLAGVPTFLDWDGCVGSVKVLLTK